MIMRKTGNALSYAAVLGAGMAFGAWILSPTPSGALVDTHQVLTGGGLTTAGLTQYTSPGFPFVFYSTQQSGKGESMAQLRMPAGQLSALRVKVTAVTEPETGILTLTVRKNGLNTILTCEVSGSGNCTAAGPVSFAANDRLSIRVINNFDGSGQVGYSYTLLFD
jgi:hypothetical protein